METANFESILNGLEFFNGLQEGIWIADGRGRIVFANSPLASLLGYKSAGSLVGRDWRELFPAREATRIVKTQPKHDVRTVPDSIILSRDNQSIPASIALARRITNGVTWYMGSAVPLRSTKLQTSFSESINRQVMENSVDGICIIRDGRTVYVNPCFTGITGYDTQQMSSMDLERIVVPGDRERVAQAVADPSRMLAPVTLSIRLITRSAHEIDCELRIVTAEANDHTVLLCFLRDVSALRHAEEARTDFIATVSHELRTPLAAIKEAVALVMDTTTQLEERQRRYLSIAQEEIDRLNRMITNLLEVSRMESGKLSFKPGVVDLDDTLRRSLDSLSTLVNKKRLTIELHLSEHLPPVLGDADRLRLVFNNLLDNAIKYTPTGSTITVSAQMMDPKAPIMSEDNLLPDAKYVQVTVSDSGPGIPAEFLDRVFGKFERVDPHGPGIGLGLAIVQSVVELHHGKVWVRSNLGEGTSFSFILPTRENQ